MNFDSVPAAIFGSFFAIPLLRAPLVWWRNRAQHAHNIRKRLFRAIFRSDEPQLTFAEIVALANDPSQQAARCRVPDSRGFQSV